MTGWASADSRPSGTLQPAGTVQLDVQLPGTWTTGVTCPPGAPPDVTCSKVDGSALVRGLGWTSQSLIFYIGQRPTCNYWDLPSATLLVAGKGEISVTASNPDCQQGNPVMSFTVTGGSGAYAGATGAGTMTSRTVVGGGAATTSWTGTLTVPGLVFDLVPPVIKGRTARTVRAPKGAKSVRVRYSVTADDAVDGPTSVKCSPRSGSRFRIGRTRVTCTATDSSANTAIRRFVITVTRRR